MISNQASHVQHTIPVCKCGKKHNMHDGAPHEEKVDAKLKSLSKEDWRCR